MKCDVCGCENKENALFCAQCGKALKDEPLELDLEQIKVPAAARKAHILKVNAKKADTGEKQAAQPEELPEEQPTKVESEGSEPSAAPEEAPAATDPAQEEVPLIDLTVPKQPAAGSADKTEEPMRIGGWIGVLLLSMIPLVNIILLFVWSFSSQTNKSKKSYARAVLILTAACAVLSAIAAVVCMVVFKINLSQFIPFFKA